MKTVSHDCLKNQHKYLEPVGEDRLATVQGGWFETALSVSWFSPDVVMSPTLPLPPPKSIADFRLGSFLINGR